MTSPTVKAFSTFDDLRDHVGRDIGTSRWLTIDQQRADQFATALTGGTPADGDRTDPAARVSTYDFFALSLVPLLGRDVFELRTPGAKLNYGLNSARLSRTLRAGDRIRSHIRLAEVAELDRGLQVTLSHRLEADGDEEPLCTAESIVLLLEQG